MVSALAGSGLVFRLLSMFGFCELLIGQEGGRHAKWPKHLSICV